MVIVQDECILFLGEQMNLSDSVILGIIQGITEFLPISSSGHLIIGKYLLNISSPGAVLEIILHMGTLVSVLLFYFKDIIHVVKGLLPGGSQEDRKMNYFLIAGTIPAVILGLGFKDFFEGTYDNITLVGVNLIVTGTVLFATLYFNRDSGSQMTLKKAIIIGCAQALAIFPGISRSGMTISMALFLGSSNKDSAKFSFLLAVPVLVGAGVLNIGDALSFAGDVNFIYIFLGFLISATVGYLCIFTLVRMLTRNKMWLFSIYCWIIGLITLIFI